MGVVTLFSSALAVLGATGAASRHDQYADSHGVWVVQTTATVIAASSAVSTADAQSLPTHPSSGLAQSNFPHLESDESARAAWHTDRVTEIVLPTSFEAADHTSAAELARLGEWWHHHSQASGVADPMGARRLPTLLARQQLTEEPYRYNEVHSDTGISILSAHHFRGQESSFTISDSETIEAVAVTLAVPHARSSDELPLQASSHAGQSDPGSLMPKVNPLIQQQQQDATLDEVLGSLRRLSDRQAVVLDSQAAEVGSFAVDDEQEIQSEPAQFTLGLEGFSAWALCAYVSVISLLFFATLMWLAFLLVRAGLGMLWATLFRGSSSFGDLPPVQAKCVGTDVHYEVVELHCGDGDCEKVSLPLLSA